MIAPILEKLQIKALNQMQEETIEASSKGKDVVLLSPTGSGKTLAFLLSILQNLREEEKEIQALIIVPSRELALQIEKVFKSMGTSYKVNSCYGGHATKTENNNFSEPPAVLVGTPGRLGHHLRKRTFSTHAIRTLVLDEFDKALELGFQEDMSEIIGKLKTVKQRILVSATEPDSIPGFTQIKSPTVLDFLVHDEPNRLTLKAVSSKDPDKSDTLLKLVCHTGNKPMLIFCNQRETVDSISEKLSRKGIIHGTFHGGMEQDERERQLLKLRNGSHKILVTTDLASRGLDIPEIEYVIHYQLPLTQDAYTHRNGRTARMSATGTAYLVIGPNEYMPPYIEEKVDFEDLPKNLPIPEDTDFITIYFSLGKKDKINKVDIVGLLLQKGKLEKGELGLIEVLDKAAYAAVKRTKVAQVLSNIKGEKLKKLSVKTEISK